MADDSKVFDVAKPGSSKPETGSKPMVIGHKIMKDLTITENNDGKVEETKQTLQAGSKTIKPLEKEESKELTNNDTPIIEDNEAPTTDAEKQEILDKQPGEKSESSGNNSEVQPTDNEPADKSITDETPEQKEKSIQENSIEQEENLQKIIKEKTYNVHIQEASLSSLKTFFKTFLIVATIGVVIIVVLIDTEILDLGVTLPFDIL